MAIFRHDIFDEIRNDHRHVMEIFDQLLETDEVSVSRRPHLIRQLREELLPHMAAEEGMFYPLLENGPKSHHMHLHAEEEHQAARLVLERLASMGAKEERFVPRCEVLRTLIRLHMAEEESVIFLTVRSKISNQQTIELVQKFQQAKADFRRQKGAQPMAA